MNPELKETNIPDYTYKFRFKDTENYTRELFIFRSPFGNCQTFTICRAYYLKYMKKDDLLLFFKQVLNIMSKRQLLIDIKEPYVKEIKDIFEKKLKAKVYKKSYKSTNTNKLTLLLIQIDKDIYKQLIKGTYKIE